MERQSKIEKLITLLAEHQRFAKPKDKLTRLLDTFPDSLSEKPAEEELTEEELTYAAAAGKPDIPKFMTMQDR